MSDVLCKRLLLCIWISVFYTEISHSQEQPEEKESELASVRLQIKDVESSIKAANDKAENLLQELQKYEIAAADATVSLGQIQNRINKQSARLKELQSEQATQEKALAHEQQQLAGQIRAAYKAGRNDYIKLLLNQEDPALVGRMIAYHEYYNRARTKRIEIVNSILQQIADRQSIIKTETGQLEILRDSQLAKLNEYAKYRDSRTETINKLHNYIDSQGKQLQILHRNEEELSLLLDKLRKDELSIEYYENLPPFDSLKGKLQWPVNGIFASRFGQQKKAGKLKWQGIMINADGGTEVQAISGGKVIFADWFRNMGLLIILDHGGGYMSLYGHNDTLLKKPGDMVKQGEVIGKVGDTGGQQRPALYFEIRQSGNPLNPDLWCRR